MDPLATPTTIEPKDPFRELPEAIRMGLTSQETVEAIIKLNQQYSLWGERMRIIPSLITRLAVKMIPAEKFTEELKGKLQMPDKDVQQIAAEIKGKILRPLATGFKTALGIDIDKIPVLEVTAPVVNATTGEVTKPAPAPIVKPQPAAQFIPITPGTFSSRQAEPKPITMPTPVPKPKEAPKPAPETANTVNAKRPFMLHEEKPTAPLSGQGFSPKESFSFHVPVTAKPATKPTAAQFGTPFEQVINKPVAPKPMPAPAANAFGTPKVVHYSALKTEVEEPKKP